MSSRLNWTL